MGETIKYPIYDKIYNHIKSINGDQLFLQKLYRDIENIKVDKETMLQLINKEKINGKCLSTCFRNVLKSQGFTSRQIDFAMSLIYKIQGRVHFSELSKRDKIDELVVHITRGLRFNRRDTRMIVNDMKHLDYFDINKNIVSVK